MSTSPTPEEIEARLRAADQAGDSTPDLTALRAAVDARIAAQSGEQGDGDVPSAPHDELAAARARRWTQWPGRVAAVAAACLVVGGGGGYAIGAAGQGSSVSDSGALPAMSLDAPAAADEQVAEGDGAGPGLADAEASRPSSGAAMAEPGIGAGADAAYRSFWPGYGMRTVFTSSGLSDEGGSATAWAFDPAAAFTEEMVDRAADVLGLEDAPELTSDGFWSVGSTDGTGPGLQLIPDGTVTLSYNDPANDPWACQYAEEMGIEPGECEQTDLGAAPRGEAAEAELTRVMEALGLDLDSYELGTEEYGDEQWTYVTAYQVVDGRRTGLSWTMSLTGGGVQSLNGPLAPVIELGEYPVISPAAAVERLGDPRFGVSGGPMVYADTPTARMLEEGAVTEEDVAGEPGPMTLPGTASPAPAPISWAVTEVSIVDSRLGFALHTEPDGAAVLVPTYELVSDEGGVWSMIALPDDSLDFAG